MAKMVKSLTVANIRNIEGMVRREDLDFTDDGNRFRGFSYKGMPITQCRSCGETYLSIRVSYLSNEFTYREWMDTKEFALCNEFNGVSEIDLDKLIENLEKVIAKVKEMNEKASNEVIDTTDMEAKLIEEIKYAESIVEEFKANFKWYDASSYELNSLIKYLKSTEKEIAYAKSIDFSKMESKKVRWYRDIFKCYGYVKFKNNDFYIREMIEALGK